MFSKHTNSGAYLKAKVNSTFRVCSIPVCTEKKAHKKMKRNFSVIIFQPRAILGCGGNPHCTMLSRRWSHHQIYSRLLVRKTFRSFWWYGGAVATIYYMEYDDFRLAFVWTHFAESFRKRKECFWAVLCHSAAAQTHDACISQDIGWYLCDGVKAWVV